MTTHLQKNTDDDFAELPQVSRGEKRCDASLILSSIGECVYEWHIGSDDLHWSVGVHTLLGIEENVAIDSNQAFNGLLLPTTARSRADAVLSDTTIDTGDGVPFHLQYALAASQIGTPFDVWLEETGRWFADASGRPTYVHGVVRVINERRALEERLERLSRFDPLTGLFNRSHLNTALEDVLQRVRSKGDSAAFLLLGIDHFELINSVYGYEAGDAVVVEIAKRLRDNLREVDIVGRFSGARLGIILDECDERSLLVAGHRILNSLTNDLVETQRGPISVSANVGGVVIPSHATSARSAFQAAHEALAESRRQRESSVAVHVPDLDRDREQKQSVIMAERIVNALREERIHLAFQPVVDAHSQDMAFFEALLRLENDDGTVLAAGDFIAVAERLGLIRLVDHHALDLALAALSDYPQAALSLNVSNETAIDPEWLSKLAIAKMDRPDIADRLIVEITESHAAESLAEAARFVDSLHDLGFRVALDDFGAGFTSFRNLKALDFDIIKIDGYFAREIDQNPENQGFIRALVDLAKLFDAKTVVEWVEDAPTATIMRDWGVDYLQGYKFGKPLRQPVWPAEAFDDDPSRMIA